jgi:hypothetical protein
MKFVQLIEFHSSRIDEFNALMDEWSSSVEGQADLPTRALQCADRDKPGSYIHIVEFPSYEVAMANSAKPETAEFAARLGKLCEGEPVFRNLDLTREETLP